MLKFLEQNSERDQTYRYDTDKPHCLDYHSVQVQYVVYCSEKD